jgi:ABC-type transport system substrate-binding protein
MAAETRTKTLRVGFLTAARNLTPGSSHDVESSHVLRNIFETPFGIAYGTTEVEPRLFAGRLRPIGADSFEAQIREGIVFSDGSPLAAEDVARSILESPLIRQRAAVRADGRKVIFTLKRPDTRFDLALSHLQTAVCRRVGSRIVGTGPYQLVSSADANPLRLARNPHYRKRVAIDEVLFRTYLPDAAGRPTALLRAIEAGEVDLTLSLGRDEMDALSGMTRVILPGLSTAMLFLNCESPRLRDRRLRQAIALAIDRMELVSSCYANPLAFLATGVTPRALARSGDTLNFNLDRARALLADVGQAPQRLEMLVVWAPRPYLPHPQKAAQMIVQQIAKLGIKVELRQPSSAAEYKDATAAGRQDLTLGGWVADIVDPCDFLEAVFHSDRIQRPDISSGACNHGRLRSPEMDAALDRFRADRRDESLAEIRRLAGDLMPVVPLMYGSAASVHSSRVTGFKPSPLWYVPAEELDLKA